MVRNGGRRAFGLAVFALLCFSAGIPGWFSRIFHRRLDRLCHPGPAQPALRTFTLVCPAMSGPKISLIINTYNQPEYLRRVLTAVTRQSRLPNEVKLADDGSGEETRQVFANWAATQSFSCKHLRQPNEGFRRCRILNQAIADSQSEYVVFLDGDTVPHWRFIEDHQLLARPGCFVQGHRALI